MQNVQSLETYLGTSIPGGASVTGVNLLSQLNPVKFDYGDGVPVYGFDPSDLQTEAAAQIKIQPLAAFNSSNNSIVGTSVPALESLAVLSCKELGASIGGFQSQIDNLNSEYTSLSSQVASFASSINTLNSEYSSLNSQVSSLSTQVAQNTSDIAGILSRLPIRFHNLNTSAITGEASVDLTSFGFTLVPTAFCSLADSSGVDTTVNYAQTVTVTTTSLVVKAWRITPGNPPAIDPVSTFVNVLLYRRPPMPPL